MSFRNKKPFRILSLDGGGIRGAFTAACLAELEKQLGHLLVEHFDLVTGTSTGGIIATALALGEPAEKIKHFYEERGPEIFARRKARKLPVLFRPLSWLVKRQFPSFDMDWLFQSKYAADRLREALTSVFEERTLKEARSCRLLIPAIDLSYGKTVVFKTPHLPGLTRDRGLAAVNVVLATTAAPTYFPHAAIQEGTAYIDGGLWANNPTMIGYAEALRIRERCRRPDIDPDFDPEDISILSIGTGKPTYTLRPPTNGAGVAWWLPRLFDVMSISQAQGVDFQARYVLGNRYERIDFEMPEDTWSLDATTVLRELLYFGYRKAVSNLQKLKGSFFSSTTSPYEPFPD
jgi:patatin-like phospholipase/acyl hydrolase